jgi:Tfp pilus assembly protein PilF
MDDAAYYLITTAHEYTRAIPLARRAMQTASHSSVTYGYATFNYGLALLKTGQCKQALPLLRRALTIEAPAQAHTIQKEITKAKACSQPGASGGAP